MTVNNRADKTDAGNSSSGICRIINASRSPSPDPKRFPYSTRYSQMKKLIRRSAMTVGVLLGFAYFGVYGYHRFGDDGGVIDCVGAFGQGNPAFTFSQHSRRLGDVSLSDSSAGPSVISRLSAWSGVSLALTANRLYEPLTRIDHLLTGRWISFTDSITPPIFSTSGTDGETIEIKVSGAELVEFEGFIYDPR